MNTGVSLSDIRVSVIVPTFNRAHFLTETIDSILSQTFKNFELIVVDNCSTDNTREVIHSYNDERLKYYTNPNNGIIAVNRNYGIRKSLGEYIAFCDDDDLWLPKKLERQLQEFEKDDQIGLVCSNLINFNENGKQWEQHRYQSGSSYITFEALFRNNTVLCSSVLLKRLVISDVGMMDESPELFRAEDYELWLRIARKYRIKYVHLPLVKYRTHSGACLKARPYIESVRLHRVVYQRLLDKGLIDTQLYRKTVAGINRRIWLLRILMRLRIARPIERLARWLHSSLIIIPF